MRTLALEELTNEQPKWFQWDVYLEQGFEPEVRFRNGTSATKRLVRIVTSKAADHPEVAEFADMKPGNEKSHGLLKVYRGPKLRIWEIQVGGPHIDQWPPGGHTRLYGELKPDQLTAVEMHRRLLAFADHAFRRPLREGELRPIITMVDRKLCDGVEPLVALQLGFQAILCSPGFIYLAEGEGPLDDFALASRLSYFLWSSVPDDELLRAASSGKLSGSQELRRHAERMLSDPKSDRFVSNFIRLWLDVDNIGEMPVAKDFKVYFRDNLDSAMRAESEAFFRHVLDENLPPSEFLVADYSFLNRELAMHYGIAGLQGNHLRKVSLSGTGRGGLMGQGLFLTASANGVDTSPVVRGVYVLEKVMGYSPPPPPPDVPEIESDFSEARTIRERLEKHRNVASCAACHRKIDPLGFALENFNAIGGWRSSYQIDKDQRPIEAGGKFPGGESFSTYAEFRSQVARREAEFTRCLTKKLLTYAIGRELGIGDRDDIDSICRTMRDESSGLRDLIRFVVQSDSFRNN